MPAPRLIARPPGEDAPSKPALPPRARTGPPPRRRHATRGRTPAHASLGGRRSRPDAAGPARAWPATPSMRVRARCSGSVQGDSPGALGHARSLWVRPGLRASDEQREPAALTLWRRSARDLRRTLGRHGPQAHARPRSATRVARHHHGAGYAQPGPIPPSPLPAPLPRTTPGRTRSDDCRAALPGRGDCVRAILHSSGALTRRRRERGARRCGARPRARPHSGALGTPSVSIAWRGVGGRRRLPAASASSRGVERVAQLGALLHGDARREDRARDPVVSPSARASRRPRAQRGFVDRAVLGGQRGRDARDRGRGRLGRPRPRPRPRPCRRATRGT